MSNRRTRLRRRRLAYAVGLALTSGLLVAASLHAGTPSVIELGDLDGTNGFRLAGVGTYDSSGCSVAGVGDINGDGIDDFVIGAFGADPNGDNSGSSYVVFGTANGFPATLDLSTLDGSNGFRLDGEDGDFSGRAVSAAGDVNGDGINDLLIGAQFAHPNGDRSGSSFVVFGSASGFPSTLNLSTLNGSNGFRLNGAAGYDTSGYAVARAGDINGDGIDDLLIGAPGASSNGLRSGSTYVVFGNAGGFAASIELSTLDGHNGFRLDGAADHEYSGHSVASAGDVNGDGIDDLVIGAPFADTNGTNSGSTYVVFGSSDGFPASMDLSTLDGSNGFRLDGPFEYYASGSSVAGAGDINGDGISDLVIGAPNDDPHGANYGSTYVVFGSAGGFPASMNLGVLDGNNGFRLQGDSRYSGRSVSAAGDINGDGIGDLTVGAPFASPNGSQSGSGYVVFGSASGFPASMELSTLDGSNGFRLDGVAAGDFGGYAVAAAGDVNGDGVADLLISAPFASPHGPQFRGAGSTYVLFGKRPPLSPTVAKIFAPSTIGVDGTSTLEITLGNPNAAVATLAALLTDTLPSPIVIANPSNATTTCLNGVLSAESGTNAVTLAVDAEIPSNGTCTVTVSVTANAEGIFTNTIPIGALQTDLGNNAAPATADLTVTAVPPVPPTLSKIFTPSAIDTGDVSMLTITLTNSNTMAASLTSTLIDTMPSSVVVADPPNAVTSCPGGAVTANAGATLVSLSDGAEIPANGSCTVTVPVTSRTAGTYTNTIPANALQTTVGSNGDPASASLTVTQGIPTDTIFADGFDGASP